MTIEIYPSHPFTVNHPLKPRLVSMGYMAVAYAEKVHQSIVEQDGDSIYTVSDIERYLMNTLFYIPVARISFRALEADYGCLAKRLTELSIENPMTEKKAMGVVETNIRSLRSFVPYRHVARMAGRAINYTINPLEDKILEVTANW